MGKGDNQRSNRETKKPKADKKLAPPATPTFKPAESSRKPAKPETK